MRGKVIQLFSAGVISIGNFLTSFSIVWPSYTLELLKSPQSPVGRITSTEGSMIGSLPMLGYFAALLVTGYIFDKFGRKYTDVICGVCFVLSWSLKANATNITTMLIARFIVGFALGMHVVVCIPFINELSQSSMRGTTTTLITFSYNTGVLVSYLCGWMLSYDVTIYLAITLATIFVVLLSFLPETPSFLLQKGKDKKALKSLKFYRGTKSVLEEIEYLKNQLHAERVQEIAVNIESDLQLRHKEKKEFHTGLSAWKILQTSKATQRALITVTIHFILLVFGGTIAVETYAAPLFKEAAPNMSAHACSVCLAMAFLLGSVFALVLSYIVGRRTQMICSSVLCAWWLAVLASLLRWSWGPEWMIPGAILAFACSFQSGIAIVPFIQQLVVTGVVVAAMSAACGRILSPSIILLGVFEIIILGTVKSLSITIVLSFMCISNFIVLAVFDGMVVALGLDGTFVTFAAVCALTALVAAAIMHETKGVLIEDIVATYERGFLYRRKEKKKRSLEGVTEPLTDA